MAEAAADEELTIDVPAPLPDPTGGTPAGNASASARQGARRYQWTGPFTVPNPVFAGSGSGTEDVAMPTASPDSEGSQAGDGQDEAAVQYVMSNAPAFPAAPKYSGSTLQEKREFMRAYQTYVHALSAFHTPTTKPYIMPASACIAERMCNLICMYELNKDPSWVSEAERVAYFLEALEPEQEDYTAIDEAMKNLKLRTTFPDAKSRMGQLRADMHNILDQNNVENIFFQKEQKKLVQYMVAALEPEDSIEAIRKRLALDQHKDLRKDVMSCYKWILGLLVAYLQWNPPSIKQNRTPNRPQGGSTTSAASASSRRQPPSGKPPQLATQGRRPDKGTTSTESVQKGSKPVVEFLKCKSTEHRVRQCPQVRPEELDGLIAIWKASRAASRTQMRRVQAAATRDALGCQREIPAHPSEEFGFEASSTLATYQLGHSTGYQLGHSTGYQLGHDSSLMSLHGDPRTTGGQSPLAAPPQQSASLSFPALWGSPAVLGRQHRVSESPVLHEEKSEEHPPSQASVAEPTQPHHHSTPSPARSSQRSLSRRPGRPDHPVWAHFEKRPKANGKCAAQCRHCQQRINTAQPGRFMVPHLVSCARAPPLVRQQWSEYLRVEAQRKQQRVQSATIEVSAGCPLASTTNAGSASAASSTPGHRSITQEDFDFALAQMIFGCALSFVLVESPFFRQFVGLLAPGVRLPSRHKLAGPILNSMREKCRHYVVARIKQQTVVSIVTDGWSDTSDASIINFMVVAPDMPALFWSSLPTGTDQHTGAYMAKELERVINEVQTETGAVVASVMTDNASNMVNAWGRLKSKLPIFAGGCAAHTINLLIQDVFKLEFFKEVREKCVAITRFVRDHHALLDEFRTLQSRIAQTHEDVVDQYRSLHQTSTLPSRDRRRALVIPIQTRWYTAHACLRSVFSNMTIIKKLFSEDSNAEMLARFKTTPATRASLDKVTGIVDDGDFWQTLEQAVKLLDPVVEVLRELESDKCATSKVYTLFRRLLTHDAYEKPNRALPAGLQGLVKLSLKNAGSL